MHHHQVEAEPFFYAIPVDLRESRENIRLEVRAHVVYMTYGENTLLI